MFRGIRVWTDAMIQGLHAGYLSHCLLVDFHSLCAIVVGSIESLT